MTYTEPEYVNIGDAEYYMGWILQPVPMGYVVYDRVDRASGLTKFFASKVRAYRYIDAQVDRGE